jgi:hypothetical protein
MKKLILILTLVVLSTSVFSQITKPDTTKKEYKNIIELNVNVLLHQFFSLTSVYYFNPSYMISYKRIFKNNAIRFGVNGSTSSDNSTQNDTIKSGQKRNSFNAGLGIEHYCYMRKRWNFFFGVDAIAYYSENYYLQGNSSISSYKEIENEYGYGVSPLIGIQFKINSRFSVSTESSYDITYTKGDDKRTETPSPIYNIHKKSHGIQSAFNAPAGINFQIHF